MMNEKPASGEDHILFMKEALWVMATHSEYPLHTNQKLMEAVTGLSNAITEAFSPIAKGDGAFAIHAMGVMHWALPVIEEIYENVPDIYPELRTIGDNLTARISTILADVESWHRLNFIPVPVPHHTPQKSRRRKAQREKCPF